MKFKSLNILVVLSIIIGSQAFAQNFTDSRMISRSYKVGPQTKIDITNKYGKVHIIPWEKDSVRFDISMHVQSSSLSRLDKVINSIDFDFTGTPYYVSAKTTFERGRSGIINELIDLAETLASGGNDVEIDYIVMAPQNVELNIDNKYGDIYLNDSEARLQISLSYGNLKAHDLFSESEISVAFGDATINSASNLNINLSYSDFEIRDADVLNIESKSSKIRIDGVNKLRAISKRDKFNIEQINAIQGEGFFTDFWIDELFDNANIDMKYGNFNIDLISKEFSFLKLNAEWADMVLFFETGSGYSIIVQHFDTNIHYPDELADVSTECINNEKKQYVISGRMGEDKGRSDVRIRTRSGNITIFHKE